ncbi:MAG: ATP-binding protein [Tepidisphaeraceae bacterium]|jgi:signal transduction histidine kinase
MGEFTRGLLVGLLCSSVLFLALAVLVMAKFSSRAGRGRKSLQRLRDVARRRVQRLQSRVARAQRLAEIGTLTGGLAHEIKNPLSTVLLNLQLLQEDLNPDDPSYSRVANRLTTVTREATRLRDILDDFLRYAGKIELRLESVNLNKLLEELVDFFTPQAQLSRVQLRLKLPSEPVIASVDSRLIKQAVLNLLLNALQAMPEGGEMILAVSTDKDDATIDIIDTGTGIAADAIDKIFDAYYSTKKAGTGLGLAMTRRIIEEHGGQIGVRSELGKGSDFFMKLPLQH